MKPKVMIGVIAAMLCVAVALIVFGVTQMTNPTDPTEPTTVPSTIPTETTQPQVTYPPLDAKAAYDAAYLAAYRANNWILNYTVTEKRYVNGDAYTKGVSGTASISNRDKESMTALMAETLTYGNYSNNYRETYCQGKAYIELAELVFSQDLSPEAFLARQIPAALLSSELYGSITGQQNENGITIVFSQPSAIENWLNPADAVLVEASGTAFLSSDGVLQESTYSIKYSIGEVIYNYTATVEFSAPETLDLDADHTHYATSQTVEDLNVLKSLMQAVGNLFTAPNIRSQAQEIIECPQIPLIYNRESAYMLQQSQSSFAAGVDYVTHITDYREQTVTHIQSDSFIDGVLTSVVDGGEPVTDPNMTQEKMRQSIEDAILAAMMAPNYLAGAVRAENESSYVIHMSGNEAFCKDLMGVITAFLQVDLDAMASSYETTVAQGYLEIDKKTQLPLSMGLTFQRIHTATTGEKYTLKYSLEHTIQLSGE